MKKVLMVTEFSRLPTGYSVYTHELLSRLSKEFDVAELACYASSNDPKIQSVPWKVFPNKPPVDTPEYKAYKSSAVAEFGEFSFNSVLLSFKPDFVIDIRDFWMMSFEHTSPFRKFYKWFIMPTVDAMPQNIEWVDTYNQADGVFTYSEFGKETLKNQSQLSNFVDVASPCASNSFFPVKNKEELRNSFGMDAAPYIIGTVMRNQRRKLYPELFSAFAEFLNETERKDVFLYCHTSFPDVGWDIPALLIQHGLCNKVLFTYKCSKCGHLSCSFFSDVVKSCNHCHSFNANICGINNPLSEQELAKVYNLFDIYVQYANSEGFGIPQLEAAQCGNVVCSVDYSAMSSFINNVGGIKIPTSSLLLEAETGCYRATPDSKSFINILKNLTAKSKEELRKIGRASYIKTLENYNWDKTAEKWAKKIRESEVLPVDQTWLSPVQILNPSPIKDLKNPVDQTNFLFSEVLHKPEWIGGFLWRRLLKELTYKSTVDNIGSFYLNEHHFKDALQMKPFSYQDAYVRMVELRQFYNTWESHRARS